MRVLQTAGHCTYNPHSRACRWYPVVLPLNCAQSGSKMRLRLRGVSLPQTMLRPLAPGHSIIRTHMLVTKKSVSTCQERPASLGQRAKTGRWGGQ